MNPFDSNDIEHLVLVDDAGRHSLWPAFADLPAGWSITYGPAGRAACLAHIAATWTDIRPRDTETIE